MMKNFSVLALAMLLVGCAVGGQPDNQQLMAQVTAREQAFAATMAARDFAAFKTFVAEDAIFYAGESHQRGREAVAAAWQPYYASAVAPFSWKPDTVEVLASGTLAHSSGPVMTADGTLVGRFNSIWRLERDGIWRVVFDKGEAPCKCGESGSQ